MNLLDFQNKMCSRMEDKILNNRYNDIEYGTESLSKTTISIHPKVSEYYEESTTEDIEELYIRRSLMEKMLEFYHESSYYEKYGNAVAGKVERDDIYDMYYYFKDLLMANCSCNIVQAFCTIAEFFEFKYKYLFDEIASLDDKEKIIDILKETHKLTSLFDKSFRLF